jgi:hypothetical protein
MARYFFDLRAGDAASVDDEGEELPDVTAADGEALNAVADAMQDAAVEGLSDQHFAVAVCDELGPVLELTVILSSKILRKQ